MDRKKYASTRHLSFCEEQLHPLLYDQSVWTTLTPFEHEQCLHKFQTSKSSSSDTLSQEELKRLMKEIGKQITEEQASQMMLEADRDHNGVIDFECFKKVIEQKKIKKYEKCISFLGLSYDYLLEEQNRSYKYKVDIKKREEIDWQFLKFYIYKNFQLDLNIKMFTGKPLSKNKRITRNQFMLLFS